MDAIRNLNTSVGRSIIVLGLVAHPSIGSSYWHADGDAISHARACHALSNQHTGPKIG